MIGTKKFIAIIPARAGSKRLKDKNILNLSGKPLLAWSIEAGLKSKYIDKVIVSSEDEKILEIACDYDAQIIKRPYYLASDTATTFDTLKHTLENIESYDYIVLLQPTSPLREAKHIDEAIELLQKNNADAIISVCKSDHSPLWSNTLPENKSMKNFLQNEIKNRRSQDLESYYKLNGAIYICNIKKLLEEETLFLQENIFAFIMDKKSSIDIDDIIDFKLAEVLLNEK
ncbi:MAG: acylneuraminate cytidylyltransferase family protein [Arcobacteraceae bacterium]|jgi:CMP-N-acetylneuraminic acid synthetase|nr:acylneuraminate cytidylyltransferase family protein [Arcobacteraceae bacterium]